MLHFVSSSHFLFLKGIKKYSSVWYLTYSKHIVPHVALVHLLESTSAEPSSVRTAPGLVCHSHRRLHLRTILQWWRLTGLLPGCAGKSSVWLYSCSHGVLLPGILLPVLVPVWTGSMVPDSVVISWCSVRLRRGRWHILPQGSLMMVYDGLGGVVLGVPQFCHSCVWRMDVVPLRWVDNRLSSLVVGKISPFVYYSWSC